MSIQIVLVEPEIPQNTGNIARTCVAIGATLHLVEPLGFSLTDKYVKRAGMDYWQQLNLFTYPSLDAFLEQHSTKTLYMVTTKAAHCYTEFEYPEEPWFLFGKESAGLPETLLKAHPDTCMRIPMMEDIRSLNIANAAAIISYEALRQNQFSGFAHYGKFRT